MRKRPIIITAIALVLGGFSARGEDLSLNKKFVDQYKNLGLISVKLTVDEALKSPHRIKSGGDDGDIHMAGRDDIIRLPLVAEIMNAKGLTAARDKLQGRVGGEPAPVTGAWRIWFEHLGKEPQIQGQTVPPPADSNPAHLFEIHPITSFDGEDVTASVDAIPGYAAYPAEKSFPFYEKVKATIHADSTSITISSGSGRYNYTELIMERVGNVLAGKDGSLFVLANVYGEDDGEEKLNQQPRRMVFLPGTASAAAAQKLQKGERLHVLGIPRVNLAEVAALAVPGKDYSGTLPYEIIVVGLLEEP